MAIDLLWVDDNLYELLKQGKITLAEHRLLCTSLAEEENKNDNPNPRQNKLAN